MLRSQRHRRFLLALSFVAGIAPVACAQCSSTYRSLEARVCLAKSVYHGSIVGFARIVIVPPGGKRPGSGSSLPGGVVRYEVNVKVDEVLKGPRRKTVTLFMETSDYDTRIDQWREQKSTFLFFVVDPEQAEGRKPLENKWPSPWSYLRLTNPIVGETDYKSDIPPIFAKDVTVLRKPAKIIARAREFGKRHPKVGKVHTFLIPHSTARLCRIGCDVNFLVVPIEPGLEATAKRMLSSPRDFVAKGTKPQHVPSGQLRLAGVDALRHFQSAENEKLLKSLLNDPTSRLNNRDFGEFKGKTLRIYSIRERAWKILKSWGVNVTKPVTLEVVTKLQ